MAGSACKHAEFDDVSDSERLRQQKPLTDTREEAAD